MLTGRTVTRSSVPSLVCVEEGAGWVGDQWCRVACVLELVNRHAHPVVNIRGAGSRCGT